MQPNSARKILDKAQSQAKLMIVITGLGHMLIGRPDVSPVLVNSVDSWIKNNPNTIAIDSRFQAIR
jgi:hypothetical protein